MREVGVLGVAFGVLVVEGRELVEGCALVGPGFERLGFEVEKGGALGAEGGALVVGGEEAVGPVFRSTLGEGHFGHNDVAGKILIFRSEAIGGPGSQSGVGTKAAAGVHVEKGLGVIQGFGLAAAIVAEFVGDLGVGHVVPLVAHVDAGSGRPLLNFEGGADVELVGAGGEAAVVFGFGLVELGEFGFGVEGVHVTGSAFHEEHDDVFGPRSGHGLFGCHGVACYFFGEKRREGDRTHGSAEAVEELTT